MGIVASLASHVLYLSEKISLCCLAVLLVSCTIITITFTLAFGIGLGYNYCFVDIKTRYKYVPAPKYRYGGSPHWLGSRYARVGEDADTDEDNLRSAQPDKYLDGINPAIGKPLSLETDQDNEEFDEQTESLDDSRIEDTTEVLNNSTAEYSTEATNATSTSSQPTNYTEGLKTTKMVIPLSGLDLIGLLTRLRAENKNYTLQIVTD